MWARPPQLRPGAGGAPYAPPHTQGPRYGLSLPAPLPAESVLLLSYSIEATSRRLVFARGDDKAPCSENHPHLPLLSEAMSLPSGERHSRCEGIPCRATGLGIHAVPGKIFFRCKPQRKIFSQLRHVTFRLPYGRHDLLRQREHHSPAAGAKLQNKRGRKISQSTQQGNVSPTTSHK